MSDATFEKVSQSDKPMSGLTQNELHLLMSGSRKSGMKPPLWATLTPTSETWTVINLLQELTAEHQAMQKRKP